MKQKIVESGEVQLVESVKRGYLLCYSDQEWMERARVQQKPLERGHAISGAGNILIAAIWTSVLAFPPIDTFILVLPLLWGGMGAVQIVFYYWEVKRNNDPVAIPGLYENGIQLPIHLFVPYPEIGKIERKEARDGLLKRPGTIQLRSRFAKKPGSITDGWSVFVEFLGLAGMACLKERLEISRGLKVGVPELVLYGPDGVKSVERGMGPANGG